MTLPAMLALRPRQDVPVQQARGDAERLHAQAKCVLECCKGPGAVSSPVVNQQQQQLHSNNNSKHLGEMLLHAAARYSNIHRQLQHYCLAFASWRLANAHGGQQHLQQRDPASDERHVPALLVHKLEDLWQAPGQVERRGCPYQRPAHRPYGLILLHGKAMASRTHRPLLSKASCAPT